MQESNASNAALRLHAMNTIAAALVAELKDLALGLSEFSDRPAGSPLSPGLGKMARAAAFCGFWGVGNYIGGLRELAHGIESVPPESVDRAQYVERVKTLAAAMNALGVYLRDLSAGVTVSYADLNEHFARVIRKARPHLLERSPAEIEPLLFMASPPSMEVDAHWTPAPGSSPTTLSAALESLLREAPTEAALKKVATANPHHSLSGFFEAAACQHMVVLQEAHLPAFVEEFGRLRTMLAWGAPLTPPAPDGFLFSRLMFSLAQSSHTDAESKALRRRYSLAKPGGTLVSMNDVARKFSEGIKKFQDAYKQASMAGTPSTAAKLSAQVLADSHRLESPAFTTVAALMSQLTSTWSSEAPRPEQWILGAALLLLMKESAETWGNQEAQASLAGLADMMAATGAVYPCETMQASTTAAAIHHAREALLQDFTELHKGIEVALRSVGNGELDDSRATRVSEVLGAKVRTHLEALSGVMRHFELPRAALYADAMAERSLDAKLWASPAARADLFESLSKLMLFTGRLRPTSMLDMDQDEQGAGTPVPDSVVVPESLQPAPEAISGHFAPTKVDLPVELDGGQAPVVSESAVLAVAPVTSAIEPPPEVVVVHESTPAAVAPGLPTVGAGEAAAALSPVGDAKTAVLAELQTQPVMLSLADPDYGIAALSDAVMSDDIGEMLAVLSPTLDSSLAGILESASPRDEAANDAVGTTYQALSSEADLDARSSRSSASAVDFFSSEEAIPAEPASLDALRAEFTSAQDGRATDLHDLDQELFTIMFEESWACLAAIDKGLSDSQAGEKFSNGVVPVVRRHIHTLKGVCRTVGLDGPGATLHAMEDRLEVLPDDGIELARLAGPFVEAMAMVRSQLEAARATFYARQQAMAPNEPEQAVEQQPMHSNRRPVDNLNPVSDLPKQAPVVAPATPARPKSAPAVGSVRIPLQLAGAIGRHSGQVLLASRRALEDQDTVIRAKRELDDNLRRMAPAIRELELMAATSIASSMAQGQAGGFDPLELDRYTQMQEVVRRLSEAFEDTMGSSKILTEGLRASTASERQRADLSDDLQRGASELLMVPVSTQAGRLEHVVAKACGDRGRAATLTIEAGCRVPAAALDRLMPVFEHILRNAIAHGIESATARASAGKPEEGRISIGSPLQDASEGGVVRVCIRDDGAGIDLGRLRMVAAQRSLVPAGAPLSDDATRELLFMPGFSTAGSVSELAGRGVGLDVVRNTLSSLGGVVSVTSEAGKGTEFMLTLPTDAASMAVIPVVSGGFKCLIPLTLIRRIVPVSVGGDVVLDHGQGKATVSGAELELIDLSRRICSTGKLARAGRGLLVLMREMTQVKAVLVDSVGQQTRVVVKPLGPFVRDIPGLIAGTTMGDGGATLVVNPLQLPEIGRTSSPRTAAAKTRPSVLVVDDSSTVRLVTSRFLKRCGFEVELARDGLEALQMLNRCSPDIFLFDLEMPGMGGFELIAEVRRRPQFAATPIIVISSRTAQKHRERAAQLGANDYLAKPYEDVQLRNVLRRHVRLAA